VEASRKLGERILAEGGTTTEARITFAFRTVLARSPKAAEMAVLKRIYTEQLAAYDKKREAALKLLTVGEAPRDEKQDGAEVAAWAMVASVLLNLDEALTRG